MGGTGADNITTGSSTSFVFGDDGYITWVGSELNPEGLPWAGANSDPTNIDLVASTDYADGGNDNITIGSGQAIVVGGAGNDHITGGTGTNIILGDSGRIYAAGQNTNPFGNAADHTRHGRDDGAGDRRQRRHPDRHRERDRDGRPGRRHDLDRRRR